MTIKAPSFKLEDTSVVELNCWASTTWGAWQNVGTEVGQWMDFRPIINASLNESDVTVEFTSAGPFVTFTRSHKESGKVFGVDFYRFESLPQAQQFCEFARGSIP